MRLKPISYLRHTEIVVAATTVIRQLVNVAG